VNDSEGIHDELILSRRVLLERSLALGALLAIPSWAGADPAFAAPEESALQTPKTKPSKIVVRAWGDPYSTALGKFPGKAFTAATGIKVVFDLSDVGEIQTKIQQALKAGQRPPVDIVYTVSPLAYASTVQKLAVPLDRRIVTNFDRLTSIGRPPSGTGYVNLYSYTLPVIYNKKKVTFAKQIDWNAIFDPKFKKSVFAASTFQPFLYPFAKMMHLDLAKDDLSPVWKKLRALRPNIASIGDDTAFITGMKSGDVTLGAGGLVGDALALRQAHIPAQWIVPAPGATLTADSMYVVRGLPDDASYYAQLFVNYVIQAQLQSKWCQAVGTVPTNSHAKPSAFMRGDPAFPFTNAEIKKHAIPEPIDLAARKNDEWQRAYTAAIR
jgi:putative spermidine/putrescine transport system substrate-binding protein